ncbi:hypothetical protein [Peribacillus simplex]|uniref:hypothetical protein n=1 Tax=Peribacillus simplex TaxID=1478 RepID=UPI0016264550|nr:hypothetical protein [Peribacillus simplex]
MFENLSSFQKFHYSGAKPWYSLLRRQGILDYMKNPELFDYENGYVNIPDKPGLGVDIDEKKVKQAAETGHDWRNPIWRKEDGIIAEW